MMESQSKTAAGSRRSALAERIRIRAEWAALKAADDASDVLSGVVVLVEVGEGYKALALRSALTALGATVAPNWSPLITHLVWSAGGSREIRARARALAVSLVSPLWVEGCAAALKRLPERVFPAATRPSDLPSPRTLKRMLKIAEKENLPICDILLNSSLNKEPQKSQRLRLSSENDNDTSHDTSNDNTTDTSTDDIDVRSKVNTVPRRPPLVCVSEQPKTSRRKLFTQKEDCIVAGSDDEKQAKIKRPTLPCSVRLTAREKRDLARAERMAKKLAQSANINTPARTITQIPVDKFRFVLTGISRSERRQVFDAIKTLNGRVQTHVNKKTTHVILGTCTEQNIKENNRNITGVTEINKSLNSNIPECSRNVRVCSRTHRNVLLNRPRTLNALLGAARGCRVMTTKWVMDSVKTGHWLNPFGYEVEHLAKLSKRARIERSALRLRNSEYVYNIFCGLKVFVTDETEQKDAAVTLLKLCGGTVITPRSEADITLGTLEGTVDSKWVFDSVASARTRNTRKYVITAADYVERQLLMLHTDGVDFDDDEDVQQRLRFS